MKDLFDREINYMRISVTDRCNLRCRYCMPKGVELVSMEEILTFEEIENIVSAAVELGIVNFKITGGEPLVRRGCVDLIKRIKGVPGVKQVTITTNGLLLLDHLQGLKEAGIDGINISLDTLDPDRYEKITGFDRLDTVLSAIDGAVDSGIPVKINAVLTEDNCDWGPLVLLAKERKLDVRFIELMPIGEGKGLKGISNLRLISQIKEKYLLEGDSSVHGNGPAVYYKPEGFKGSIGFISAIHGKYCSSCNRIRLTSTGDIKPCLCYGDRVSLKGISDREEIISRLKEAAKMKPECHRFEEEAGVTEFDKMAQIGG